jgi:hypothetical protein
VIGCLVCGAAVLSFTDNEIAVFLPRNASYPTTFQERKVIKKAPEYWRTVCISNLVHRTFAVSYAERFVCVHLIRISFAAFSPDRPLTLTGKAIETRNRADLPVKIDLP